MTPGLYQSIPRGEYEALRDAANYSTLKLFERSAAHAKDALDHPKPPSDAMEVGQALHLAVLEPERFKSEVARLPKMDRRTKEGKALWADFEANHKGCIILDGDDYERVLGMQAAIRSHPEASLLFAPGGMNEATAIWQDAETGLTCKARLDKLTTFYGQSAIPDLKSTPDARWKSFRWKVKDYSYHAQMAFYLDGLATLAPRDRFPIWVAVESERPFGVICHQPGEGILAEGRQLYRKWLVEYAECKKSGVWPCYASGIEVVEFGGHAQ